MQTVSDLDEVPIDLYHPLLVFFGLTDYAFIIRCSSKLVLFGADLNIYELVLVSAYTNLSYFVYLQKEVRPQL